MLFFLIHIFHVGMGHVPHDDINIYSSDYMCHTQKVTLQEYKIRYVTKKKEKNISLWCRPQNDYK